jgi:hypothetical protein
VGPRAGLDAVAKRRIFARFEGFAAVKIQVEVFWVLTPCVVMVGYQRFRGPCCLHLQGQEILASYHNTTWRHNPEDHVLKKNLCPCRESNPDLSARSLVTVLNELSESTYVHTHTFKRYMMRCDMRY